MDNLKIEAIDPLVDEPLVDENDSYFYADEQMVGILLNEDIQTYLDYINKKYQDNKKQVLELEQVLKQKQELKQELEPDNNYKRSLITSICSNIAILEENLKNLINKD